MKKIVCAIAAVGIIAVLCAGCSSKTTTQTANPTPANTDPVTSTSPAPETAAPAIVVAEPSETPVVA